MKKRTVILIASLVGLLLLSGGLIDRIVRHHSGHLRAADSNPDAPSDQPIELS